MKQKWKPMQFVEISMHEIFCLQDRLDKCKDNPKKVWEIFDDFLMECENQLELSPEFVKSMEKLDLEKDFVDIDNIDDLFDNEETRDIDSELEYLEIFGEQEDTEKFKKDIPFSPRHDF